MTEYVRVPVEPTTEMVAAGGDAIKRNGGEGTISLLQSDAIVAYKAMIAAAPQDAKPIKRGEA